MFTITDPSSNRPHCAGRIRRTVPCSAALAVLLLVGCNQDTPSGVTSLIDACTPLDATGPAIRAALTDAGWTAQAPRENPAALRDIIASQMWSLMPDDFTETHAAKIDEFVPAFTASLGDPDRGQLYSRPDEVAVVLSQGDDLSCFWAGADSDAFTTRAATAGPFPDPVNGMTVHSVGTQDTLTDGAGRGWTRHTRYARLSENDHFGTYAVAARLDRSPVP